MPLRRRADKCASGGWARGLLMARPVRLACVVFLVPAFLVACAPPPNGNALPDNGDAGKFRTLAQPVAQRHCAFEACHGRADLALFLYAVDYARLATGGPGTPLDEQNLSPEELDHNQWAMAVRVDAADPHATTLLRKLRPVSDGGEAHFNVAPIFTSRSDPDYVALCQWATTVPIAQGNAASCGAP